MKAWGLLPEDVRRQLSKREWDNSRNLRQRLMGEREFPIQVNLRPPTGKEALGDVKGFHEFIAAWRDLPERFSLEWKSTRYTQVDEQNVPIKLTIGSIEELIEFLGASAKNRSRQWRELMAPILEFNQGLYPALIRQLDKVEALSSGDANLIARLLPQLTRNMGHGCYMRALPITGVDTKFLETHQSLITAFLDQLNNGEIGRDGGLSSWLGCVDLPMDWLWLRPLCGKTRKALGGLSVMRLPSEVIIANPLPGKNILVVENEQSGYALRDSPNTVVVFGGGRNLTWMDAPWLEKRNIGYWGDLDTWGFVFLSEARKRQPHLTSLLMDRETLLLHQERMVEEPGPYPGLPENLTESEHQLYLELRNGVHGNTRLEQERISPDYLHGRLSMWLDGVVSAAKQYM